MNDLFKNTYRIPSNRLKGWDYASPGYYFVTICTRDREALFGEVVDDQMRLTPVGEIAAEEWQKTGQIRPNVDLDEWVVMPNHIHGIIIINGPDHVETLRAVETFRMVETFRRNVSTTEPTTTPPRLRANSLGAIINQFKSICTKRIRKMGHADFAWQSRYYDHIIRDEPSLGRIRAYIKGNPVKWATDEHNPAHEGK